MAEITKLEDFTNELKVQHTAILKVAAHNLNILIDQVQTLDHPLYDEILECLDSTKEVLETKQAILAKASNG